MFKDKFKKLKNFVITRFDTMTRVTQDEWWIKAIWF